MIASVTRQMVFLSDFNLPSTMTLAESRAKMVEFNTKILAYAVSSGLVPLLVETRFHPVATWPFQLFTIELKYGNTLFDTHDDCIKAARDQPTVCTLIADDKPLRQDTSYDSSTGKFKTIATCGLEIHCSSLKGTVINTGHVGTVVADQALLANPAIGQCNDQANVSSCTNINSNCASLERFRAGFEDLARKIVFTPEALCHPFVKNPPYACTKLLPPSVPSILSQALAFFTSALAAVKTALFFCTEMRHKCHNKAPSKDDGAPGTNGDVKAQKGASKPSDTSVAVTTLTDDENELL
jgi:hypothetical protein